MNSFNKLNNILGWATFLVSLCVYTLTMEATASFWDCGEFIASAFKLQVGHPPGAPLFLMIARVFMTLGGNNLEILPVYVNFLSALSSAFAILFLFWSITHLARKIFANEKEMGPFQLITVLGSGLIGAVAFTFSESFWFSAVEGEVYAMSIFFTAITFWAMLKWEDVAHEKHGDKWIVFIAYLTGLSIGVHLLSLLAIPAIALIYYYKRYTPTFKGATLAFLAGVAIVGFIFAGIIPGTVSLAASFDVLFVNSFGLPFGSGVWFYVAIVIGLIAWGLFYTTKKNKPLWNTAILSTTFILIGYLSFGQILVRSLADPPMDENNPENPHTLLSYLNREQYGDRPLLYGPYYNAKVIDYEEGAMTYAKGADKYTELGPKIKPVFDPAFCTVFPRMHSSQGSHIARYKEWAGIKGEDKPTFTQNLKFFFAYQFGHMYWRYFMWNFSGRQNDVQGLGSINEGNWITGIKLIDGFFLGNQEFLPKSITENKAHNKFFALPFILGLIGMFWHFKKRNNEAWVVMWFFLFTGVINLIYLNQPPVEPRERDYTLVGSFYAYAIWIGLGVAATADFLRTRMNGKFAAILATLFWGIVPALMAKDGWDDHDRSLRKTSRDFAYNYLNSCAPNAIIFTNGDNDTFPLWYIQDVEGVRTDVRIVNLSLLNTDWYIAQMKRQAYESEPVPFSLTLDEVEGSKRDYVPLVDKGLPGYQNIKDVIAFIRSNDPRAMVRTQSGGEVNFAPTKKFSIPVDSAFAVKSGMISEREAAMMVKSVDFELDKNYILKNELMILDLLATNDWKRPVYFAITVGSESYLNLEDYFRLEGLAYRLVPIKQDKPDEMGARGTVGTDIMYDNLMNKFKWGNMENPKVYLDENNLRMTMNFRNNFARLSSSLLEEGKRDSALAVLDKCQEVMPDATVPYNLFMLRIIDMYYRISVTPKTGSTANADMPSVKGMGIAGTGGLPSGLSAGPADKAVQEKAVVISRKLMDIMEDDLRYYTSLKGKYAKGVERDIQQSFAVMGELRRLARNFNQEELFKDFDVRVNVYREKLGLQ